MQKELVINYLDKQLEKIQEPSFSLDTWKVTVAAFLDQVFGRGNSYAANIRALTYLETISYEELYPKKIIDEKGSRAKFRNFVTEIKEQIALMDEDVFATISNSGQEKGAQALKAIIDALHNNLTGRQLSELRKAAKEKLAPEEFSFHVKKMDADILQNLVSDILACKEVWENMDS
jgi:hypothetical protein